MPDSVTGQTTPAASSGTADAGAALNKAKAAFDQYRQKMSGAPGLGGSPAMGPFPVFPPPGAGMAPGSPWPFAGASPGAPAAAPLAEGVGQLLRLGVAFATTALASGLQLMQGFSGVAHGSGPSPNPGFRCGCGRGYYDDGGCGSEGYSRCDCGCSCRCDDCCRAGVHNCRNGCGCC